MKRDYYTVYLGDDVTDPAVRKKMAIDLLKSRARFVDGCSWEVVTDDGIDVKVCRYRPMTEADWVSVSRP